MESKENYVVIFDSYEGDGDYERTDEVLVETIEQAKAYWELSNLLKKLGSKKGFSKKDYELITNFLNENFIIMFPEEDLESALSDVWSTFVYLVGDIIGYSEHWQCRLVEDCTVFENKRRGKQITF